MAKPFATRSITPPWWGRSAVTLSLAALLWSCSPLKPPGLIERSKPHYGAWGFDSIGADVQTRPGNDFFRYANGHWLDTVDIPSDQSEMSIRVEMTNLTEERLHQILERAATKAGHRPSSVEGKVGAFYRSFMNERHIERLGATPLAPQLAAVRAAQSRDAIAALMGRHNSDFESGLFEMSIDVDLQFPARYAVYLSQAGVSLPDGRYLVNPEFASEKSRFELYAATLLQLVAWPDAPTSARQIVELETRVALVSWNTMQNRDLNANYNPMTLDELQKLATGFRWRPFLDEAGLKDLTRIIVRQRTAIPRIASIFEATPLDTLRAWLAYRIVDNSAVYLSKPFVDAHFEFRRKTLLGQQEQAIRWKQGVRTVSGGDPIGAERTDVFGNLGWAVGQLYTAQYFPTRAKREIELLVANLTEAYRSRIQSLDWMSLETKTEALKKLDTYSVKVGYPDRTRDYSDVVIRDDDLVGNVRRAAAADWRFSLNRLNSSVDRSQWLMTPQTNDAYNSSLRDIVFPAGILQPPIFDANADPAINYGAAGSIIGHELTHGFDDQGRKVDASGALRDWWTPADANTFSERASKLGAQYSAFEPIPGFRVNGAQTMGENIADLGGVSLALDAYRASLGGKPAPTLNGLTGDQRVLLGWAQVWRGKARDQEVKRRLLGDVHSPRRYRVNGVVRNLDAWYEAFDVTPWRPTVH